MLQFGKRPVIAYSSTTDNLRRACLQQLSGETWRRRAIRFASTTIAAINADKFLFRKTTNPFDVDGVGGFSELTKTASAILKQECAAIAVTWPPQPSRKRRYIFFLDSNACLIAFGKCCSGAEDERAIDREMSALKNMDNPSGFRIPKVLGDFQWNHGRVVLFQPIPQDAQHLQPSQLSQIATLVGGKSSWMSFDESVSIDWIQDVLNSESLPPKFVTEFEECIRTGFDACLVHGDFGAQNVKRCGGNSWVYDWEHSHLAGPTATDSLHLELSYQAKQIWMSNPKTLRRIANKYIGENSGRAPFILALGYLASIRSTLAIPIIHFHFDQ